MDSYLLTQACLSAAAGILVILLYRLRMQWTAGKIPRASNPTDDVDAKVKTYRLTGCPLAWDRILLRDELASHFKIESQTISIKSFAREIDGKSNTATVTFQPVPPELKSLSENHALSISHGMDLDYHFVGLTTLFRPPPGDHKIDVVALSGLGGHAFGSFKAKGNDHMWLRDSLPHNLSSGDDEPPMARVLIYGYRSKVADSRTVQHLGDLAQAFRGFLSQVLSKSVRDHKPIILIGHSLGGLVIKETLIYLYDSGSKEWTNLQRAGFGLVFFGVPHSGMKIEFLRAMAGSNPNRVVEALDGVNSHVLVDQQRRFPRVLGDSDKRRITPINFFELEKSPTAEQNDQGVWEMTGPLELLVSPSSGAPDRTSDFNWPISGTHSTMVKFPSQNDASFKTVADKISDLAMEVVQRRTAADLAEKEKEVVALNTTADDKRNAYCEELHFDGMDDRRRDLQQAMLEGTCQWLFQKAHFIDWMNDIASPSQKRLRLLRVEGKPGCGKSVLMRAAEDYCVKANTSRDLIVLGFYFDARSSGNSLHSSASGMYRHLLTQLLERLEPATLLGLGNEFLRKYKNMSPKDLQHAIVTVFKHIRSKSALIFLDAIDECADKDVEDVLDFIQSLLADVGTGIGVCLSACEFSNFDCYLDSWQTSTISVQEENKQDIDHFIHKELQMLKRQRPDLCKKLIPLLSRRASNIFLWARCVIKEFVKPKAKLGRLDEEILQEIDKLPMGLLELYQYLLKRVIPDDYPEACHLFQFVRLAMRPLTEAEVGSLLEFARAMKFKSKPLTKDRIRLLSCGLIECRPRSVVPHYNRAAGDEDPQVVVQFIHNSVADFVTHENGLPTLNPQLTTDTKERMHLEVSSLCMRVLDQSTQRPIGTEEPQFLPYAAQFWTAHARKGDVVTPTDLKCPDFVDQCGDQAERVASLFRKHTDTALATEYAENEDVPDSRILEDSRSLLVVFAYEGCMRLTVRHLGTCRRCLSGDPAAADVVNAAFFWAVQRGFTPTVKAVLSHPRHRIDINKLQTVGATPLFTACCQGNRELVTFLLENGADVFQASSPNVVFTLPLHAAVAHNMTGAVEAILQHQSRKGNLGSLLTLKNQIGLTAIQLAVFEGRQEILERLLASSQGLVGVLDQKGPKDMTAFQLAVFFKDKNGRKDRRLGPEAFEIAAKTLEKYGGGPDRSPSERILELE